MITEKFIPTHLKPWTHPSNYFGATWEGWYPFLTQTRDSDTLPRSNYRVALARLQQLSTDIIDEEGEEISSVTDTRESHFACGWLEVILIHESNEEALRLADSMASSLEGYAVLDEFDWSELEWEEAHACWESWPLSERVEVCKRFNVSIFSARHDKVPSDPSGELISYLADGC